MSLDHYLDQLPRLSDKDCEAIGDQPSLTPAVASIIAKYRSIKPKTVNNTIEKQREAILGVLATIGVCRAATDKDDLYDLNRVLGDAYSKLDEIAGALENIHMRMKRIESVAGVDHE